MGSTGLVDEVDGLVGQEAVADVLGALANGILDDLVAVSNLMELLVALPQTFENLDGLIDRGFGDVYLLEAAHDALAACEVAVVFVVGGASDEADVAPFEVGLEHVGGIVGAVVAAGSDHIVYLVDIDDGLAFFRYAVHHLLDAPFEVAAILCAGQHRAHIHHVHLAALQTFGNIAVDDTACQSVDKSCLADPWLAHMQWVVLVLAAEHLDGALEFALTSDKGVGLVDDIVEAADELLPLRCVVVEPRQGVVVVYRGIVSSLVGFDEIFQEVGFVSFKVFLKNEGSP